MARVHLRRAGERLFLKIEDSGAGFDAAEFLRSTDEDRGFGLRGMRDRVHLFAGHFTVRSQPGAGTTLEIEVPFERAGEALR
jgi:two-component system NarL family sensor kinase